MQIEITLAADPSAGVVGRDLGFLLNKHPDRVFTREISCGQVVVFFPEATDEKTRAVLFVDADPVGMVRRAGKNDTSLLQTYVNDRAYSANSFLSMAMSKALGQTMSGKSAASRPELSELALPFEIRIRPIRARRRTVLEFFEPLGLEVVVEPLEDLDLDGKQLLDVRLKGRCVLSQVLRQVYVLVPALDGWKHWFVSREEIDNIWKKGEGWLENHPLAGRILAGSFSKAPSIRDEALERLSGTEEYGASFSSPAHDERLDFVVRSLVQAGARSVLDLGCGEGKLLRRLVEEPSFTQIAGFDLGAREVERARRSVGLHREGNGRTNRVSVEIGSLLYRDDRWKGFDAAALVEVIEHVDETKLDIVERVVFGDARPRTVVVTTPNAEFNATFVVPLLPGQMRHPDHRFEWTRQQFGEWARKVCDEFGYTVEISGIGTSSEEFGSLSQAAVFKIEASSR